MADNSQKLLLNTQHHHQFLTVPQELDEDSWISGEELFTEGSSDDESRALSSAKKSKNAINNRRRFSVPKQAENDDDEDEDSDECAGAVKLPGGHNRRSVESLEWRPKRGSLKFSDLLTTTADDESADFNSEDLDFLQRPLINVMEYLGDNERLERIQSIRLNIQDLEKRFTETDNLLQTERKERLLNQKSVEDYVANDEFLFESVNAGTIDQQESEEKCTINKTSTSEENNAFIKRNIELAAKAMTKLPFTDEEKEKLEQILSETAPDEEQTGDDSAALADVEEQTHVNNGYQISQIEKTRIEEINAQLKEFDENTELQEASSSTSLSNIDGISFWDNIVLDQALKNVNAKLAELETKNKD